MKFFTDQDVYQITVDYLKSIGYDVLMASDVGLQRASDEELLHYAYKHERTLITRDKDYGALVFLNCQENCGVILLRVQPQTVDAVHKELARFLEEALHEVSAERSEHSEVVLRDCFVVIEPGRHRIRKSKLSGPSTLDS